jgi:hypothetical protein
LTLLIGILAWFAPIKSRQLNHFLWVSTLGKPSLSPGRTSVEVGVHVRVAALMRTIAGARRLVTRPADQLPRGIFLPGATPFRYPAWASR